MKVKKTKARKAKKAEITLENTLTVILAALGLILLFAGAYKLYQIIVNQEQENAKNFINVLEAKINALQDGESNIFSIRGIKSETWFLTGWGKDDPDRLIDKIECFLDSCICICEGEKNMDKDYWTPAQILLKCQKQGFCRKIDKDKVKLNSIIIIDKIIEFPLGGAEPGTRPTVKESQLVNYISLPKNLISLQINKTSSDLTIIKYE